MNIFLKTSRILLREFTPEDFELLLDLDSDPEVMKYLTDGKPSSREYIKGAMERIFQLIDKHNHKFGLWAAINPATNEFMGWFHFRPGKATPDDLSRIELGYRLKQKYWGKGLATEGSIALIEKGFNELGVQQVFAITLKDNLKSQNVMKKVGMTFCREYQNTEPLHGENKIIVEYSLDKQDWHKRQ